MNAPVNIATPIEEIDFSDLYVSDLNPRTIIDDEGIKRLADNIVKVGLIQNLAGYREDGRDRVGIVAGGRRLRALALLQKDPRFQKVLVRVTADATIAEQWAISENANRVDLEPAEEIRSYGRLADNDIQIADIAVAYGVTEKQVYRRLALAKLPAPILDALQEGQISLGLAAAFTVGTDEKLMLELLQQQQQNIEKGWRGFTEYQLKEALAPDSVAGTDRRFLFVGMDAYKEAGGRVTDDLFDEGLLLDDPAILEDVFKAKLTEAAEAKATSEGWKWYETFDGSYIPYDVMESANYGRVYPVEGVWSDEETARHDALSQVAEGDDLSNEQRDEMDALETIIEGDYTDDQKTHAGFLIYVGRNGELLESAGLVRSEDREQAEDAGIIEPSKHAPVAKVARSPISDKLRTNLNRISTGARQDALLNDPQLALHLLAFQLCGKMGYNSAFGMRMDNVPNQPDTETGYTLDKRLTTPEKTPENPFDSDLMKDFQTFRRRGDDKIMAVLNRFLVGQLSVADADLGGLIDKATQRNTRKNWTPNAENFFGKVGGPYLVALWADLLDLDDDHTTVTSFSALKKGEKAAKLDDLFNDSATRHALGLTVAQVERIGAWLPEGME